MMLPSEHSNARFSVSKKSSPHFPSGSVWSGVLSPRAYAHLHAGWHLYAAITCCGNNMNHGGNCQKTCKNHQKSWWTAPFPHIEHDSAIFWCLWCVSQAFLRSFVLRFWGTYAPQAGYFALERKSVHPRFHGSKVSIFIILNHSSSNFLGVLPSYNKSINYYRLSSNYHLIIIIDGLSIWNSTAWFPFSSFSSRIHPCAQVQLTMATSPESKFVDRFRQASWVPQMVTYGIDWHCGAPFLADFLFFWGGMLLTFLGGDNFYRCFSQHVAADGEKKVLVAGYSFLWRVSQQGRWLPPFQNDTLVDIDSGHDRIIHDDNDTPKKDTLW